MPKETRGKWQQKSAASLWMGGQGRRFLSVSPPKWGFSGNVTTFLLLNSAYMHFKRTVYEWHILILCFDTIIRGHFLLVTCEKEKNCTYHKEFRGFCTLWKMNKRWLQWPWDTLRLSSDISPSQEVAAFCCDVKKEILIQAHFEHEQPPYASVQSKLSSECTHHKITADDVLMLWCCKEEGWTNSWFVWPSPTGTKARTSNICNTSW